MEAIYFDERWKYITENSVPNIIENAYLISDEGRVFSCLSNTYLTQPITRNGYCRVCLRLKSKISRYYSVHRILMIEFNYVENYDKLQVNHFNGNKENNKIWNLEWTTPSENIIHAYNNNLKSQKHGEECSYATISNKQAEQIAQMILSDKYNYQEIANIIGCTKSVVSDIATGSTWKEIYKKYNLEDHKKKFTLRLSDDDLNRLCKYWEDHNNISYRYNNDLFKESLMNLFGIEYTNNMSATLCRLYRKQTRHDIVDKYNF